MAKSRSSPVTGPYLPPSLVPHDGTPQAGFPSPVGKSRSIQMTGSLIGRQTAGLYGSMKGPDQQFRNAFGHYGKPRESKL